MVDMTLAITYHTYHLLSFRIISEMVTAQGALGRRRKTVFLDRMWSYQEETRCI